jgi:hypothetical protein
VTRADERTIDIGGVLPLAIGLGGLAVGTAFGWDSRLVDALVTPPPIIRAVLVGAGVLVGLWLLRSSIDRLRLSRDRRGSVAVGPGAVGPGVAEPDVAGMVRGIRLTFLAVAALAAAIGWLLGHPLPLVLALVIGGVDVLETSFLLLVVTFRSDR